VQQLSAPRQPETPEMAVQKKLTKIVEFSKKLKSTKRTFFIDIYCSILKIEQIKSIFSCKIEFIKNEKNFIKKSKIDNFL